MTTSQFISNLKGRYPDKLDNFTIKDMEEGLNSFNETDRERLFTSFKDEYVYSRSPRWADLNKIAFNAGISRNKPNPLKHAFNICNDCNTSYSAIGRICPGCHKITGYTISNGERSKDFMRVREDCGQCKLYVDNHTDGVHCTDFGTTKCDSMEMCRTDCKCNRCCWETLAISQGLDGDTSKFDKLTSKNKWQDRLLEECKRL